jgi:hypothetical protein
MKNLKFILIDLSSVYLFIKDVLPTPGSPIRITLYLAGGSFSGKTEILLGLVINYCFIEKKI